MPSDSIKKINTNNGVTGNSYLTNDNSITVDGTTYDIGNGFDFYGKTLEVQEAAKFKKTFTIGDTIPHVPLDGEIVLNELYNEAHRYSYTTHSNYEGADENTHSVDIPDYIVGWEYLSGSTLTQLPSTLNSSLAEEFVNGNLDVYANWANDLKAVRIILFYKGLNNPLIPSGSVTINSQTSYSSGDFRLTQNYSKIIHHESYFEEDLRWASFDYVYEEFGRNTGDGVNGNGCPVIENNGVVPCYYGVKSGDSLTIVLSTLNGLYTNGYTSVTYSNAFKPYIDSNNFVYERANHLSVNFTESNYTPYTSALSGTYSISINALTTDLTLFLPVVLNSFYINVKCSDVTNVNPSSTLGMVEVLSILNNGFSALEITAECINSETVTISAQPNQYYIFSHWEDANGNTISGLGSTFNLLIDSTINDKTYVACFDQAPSSSCVLTYHKHEV